MLIPVLETVWKRRGRLLLKRYVIETTIGLSNKLTGRSLFTCSRRRVQWKKTKSELVKLFFRWNTPSFLA